MKPDVLKQLNEDRAAKRPVVLATNLTSGDQKLLYQTDAEGQSEVETGARAVFASDKPATIETVDGPVFLNVFNPPLRMIVVGAVHISQALAPMAKLAGYQVVVVDPRGAWATAERFPGVDLVDEWPDDAMEQLQPDRRTAVVTLTHDPKLDDPALAAALKSDAFYIGSLGSTRTHAKRLQRLERLGFTEQDMARIHGPIGLSIGAKSPAEIAVSIMGQITQDLRQEAA